MTPERSKLYAFLLGITVLLAGIAIGASGMGFFARAKFREYFLERPPGSAEAVLYTMESFVQLTPEQKRKFAELYDAQEVPFNYTRLQCLPQINGPKYRFHEKVESFLSDSQREGYRLYVGQLLSVRRPAVVAEFYATFRLAPGEIEKIEAAISDAVGSFDPRGMSDTDAGWAFMEKIRPQVESALTPEHLAKFREWMQQKKLN